MQQPQIISMIQFNQPLYSPRYPDLNTDINLQKKITNSVWTNLSNEWILSYKKLLKYVLGSPGSYRIATNPRDVVINDIDNENLKSRADWLLKNYYKKSDLINTIEKFRSKLEINLWDVDTDSKLLKKFINHQIMRKIFTLLKK